MTDSPTRDDSSPKPRDGEADPAFNATAPMESTLSAPTPMGSSSTKIGPYHILQTLGEGGMGTVYIAEQREPMRRKVALKVIKAGMDTKEVLARFEVEHHALTIMNHPNIARVFDAGATPEGRPYFVMEYVPGIPLTEYCDQNRLSPQQRLRLFVSICHAVQHAHQKSVLHRDLKPANILVMLQDGQPVPKIIDFGVAKATGQQLTEQTLFTELGQIIGTPEYMSPEQAEMSAIDVDTRTDVYSLGVILYELLSGALPFDSRSLREGGYVELQRIICQVEPPKPSTRVSADPEDLRVIARNRSTDSRALARVLRGDLDWITMKALEKDRTRRYASASALAADVERHLRDETVTAGPPSVGYQLRKLLRRNRPMTVAIGIVLIGFLTALGAGQGAPAVAGGVVVLLLLVGFGINTTLLRRTRLAQQAESQQRILAEEQRKVAELKERAAQEARRGEAKQRKRAQEKEAIAEEQRRLAEANYQEMTRLYDTKRLSQLESAAEQLWPAVPGKIDALKTWLEEARDLAEHLPSHSDTLMALRDNALPHTDEDARRDREEGGVAEAYSEKVQGRRKLRGEISELEKDLETHEEPQTPAEKENGAHVLTRAEKEAKLAALNEQFERASREVDALEPRIEERRTWRFENPEDQFRHDVLTELVAGIEDWLKPVSGTIASVEERIEFAESIEGRSVSSPDARAAWSDTVADIAKLPVYGGLQLRPQLGLLPLGRDPRSGLWEFWCIASGERPAPNPDRDAVSPWLLHRGSGLILVLIPGGTFWMGTQKSDPDERNYVPESEDDEGPPHAVTLGPYFLSRYLMTQGQWLEITGSNPSYGDPDSNVAGKQHSLEHPVEQVTWFECREVLGRLGLVLPTEAQWENAARGGTTTRWWTGSEPATLQGAANLADRFAKHNGPLNRDCDENLFDGYQDHSPVGTFEANPFGLHDVHGNVWEWCRDPYAEYDKVEPAPGDGERLVPGAGLRIFRGGAYGTPPLNARVSFRYATLPAARLNHLGCRPARVITE